MLAEGVGYSRVMYDFFFKKSPNNVPKQALPSVKNDLSESGNENFVVWFGHSSYLMVMDGLTVLVDPVFSGHASPIGFTTKSFEGTDVYTAADMPELDLLIITHDHWDHLDYETLTQLRPKTKKIVTSLGVGAHLQRWNFDKEIIHELDWNEHFASEAFKITALPA